MIWVNKLSGVQNLRARLCFENLVFLISFRDVLGNLNLLSRHNPSYVPIFIPLILIHIKQLLEKSSTLARHLVHILKNVLDKVFAKVNSSQEIFIQSKERKTLFEIVFIVKINVCVGLKSPIEV